MAGHSEIAAANNHNDYFLYKDGAATTYPSNVVHDSAGHKLLDISNVNYRTHIIQRLVDAMLDMGLDGVYLDQIQEFPDVCL